MIENKNDFFLNLRRCVSRGSTLHIQPSSTKKKLKMYIYKGEIKKKKKNEHQNLIKKKKMSEFFFIFKIFFSNDEDAFLESLHSIFSHLQHKKLATVSFYNKK